MVDEDVTDHYAHHDPEGGARLSTTLVHALADIMSVDVTDAGIVLGEVIDPAALDRLFIGSDTEWSGHVAFSVEEHRITVYRDGTIVITPPREPSSIPEQ